MKPSTPSSPQNPASAPAKPASGWRKPEPGDVLSYAYLWHREAAKGQEEGLKDRPTVVVLASTIQSGRTVLVVVPVTHSEPEKGLASVELPLAVKRDLGLDAEPSYIMCDEVNRFIWPGPDVRPVGSGDPIYGAIPDWLFETVRKTLGHDVGRGELKVTRRSD